MGTYLRVAVLSILWPFLLLEIARLATFLALLISTSESFLRALDRETETM